MRLRTIGLSAALAAVVIAGLVWADFVAESVLEGRVGRRGDILGRPEVTVLRRPIRDGRSDALEPLTLQTRHSRSALDRHDWRGTNHKLG